MKHIVLILLTILQFEACNRVDRTDFNSVAKAVDKALQKQDLEILRPLYIENIENIHYSHKEIINYTFNQFKNNQFTFIKSDFEKSYRGTYELRIFYLDNQSNIYCVSIDCTLRNGTISLGLLADGIYSGALFCGNWTESQKEYDEEPYCPKSEIIFQNIRWYPYNYDYNNLRGFESLEVLLKNNSEYEIDYMRFRLIIRNNHITMFNQTIESYQMIYKGDMVYIDIPTLKNFYTGYFSNNTLNWSAELMEVSPKPKSFLEDVLEELESTIKKRRLLFFIKQNKEEILITGGVLLILILIGLFIKIRHKQKKKIESLFDIVIQNHNVRL